MTHAQMVDVNPTRRFWAGLAAELDLTNDPETEDFDDDEEEDDDDSDRLQVGFDAEWR